MPAYSNDCYFQAFINGGIREVSIHLYEEVRI